MCDRSGVNGDRRCDSRTLVTTHGPHEEGTEVRREWSSKFTLAGAPELEIGGHERARFRGDRIELLEVTLTPETLARFMRYVERFML